MRRHPPAIAASLLVATIGVASPAAAKVDLHPTGLTGASPRLAPAKDGSLHVLYYAPAGLRHARLVSGAFVGDALLPDSGSVSRAKYNRPSLDVGPDSIPHVVWGPSASWTDATTHSKGVWYWNGSATKQIFGEYTEYVALGVSNAGKKMFATAVVFLPGDTVGAGVGSAELKGDVLGPITRFSMPDIEGKHVTFCKGDDAALHLVWRMQKVRYARFDGSAWSAVEGLGGNLPSSAELPSCAVDAKGRPHVAWLRWQDTGGGKWAPVDLRYANKSSTGWVPATDGANLRTLAAGGTSPGVAVSGEQVLLAWTEGSTLFSRLSSDGGVTFSPAEAQVTDVDPGDDLGDNAPQLPVVFYDGKFQTLYSRKDGTLVRAVWVAPAPVVDAGTDAAVIDAAVDPDAEAGTDAGTLVDATSPADAGKRPPTGSDIESSDPEGCGCGVVGAHTSGGLGFFLALALLARRRCSVSSLSRAAALSAASMATPFADASCYPRRVDERLRAIVDRLLVEHQDRVDLDAIGAAIGSMAIDIAGIEAILDAIEAAGRTIVAPSGGTGVAALRKVVPAARTLATELGRTARISEIADRTHLTGAEVRQALLLAKVMGR